LTHPKASQRSSGLRINRHTEVKDTKGQEFQKEMGGKNEVEDKSLKKRSENLNT
jgi:hypothetical protein